MPRPQQDVADERNGTAGRGRPDGPIGGARASGISPNDVAWIRVWRESLSPTRRLPAVGLQLRKYNDLKGAEGSTVLASNRRLRSQTPAGSPGLAHRQRGRDPAHHQRCRSRQAQGPRPHRPGDQPAGRLQGAPPVPPARGWIAPLVRPSGERGLSPFRANLPPCPSISNAGRFRTSATRSFPRPTARSTTSNSSVRSASWA